MKRRVLLLGALVCVAVAGVAAAYVWNETRPRELRGSATDEFVATANPADTRTAPVEPDAPETRPQTEPQDTEPTDPTKPRRPLGPLNGTEWWPTYGYDENRTRVAPYGLTPPYRTVWRFRSGHYLEFPPAVAYGRIYVPQQAGRFYAVNVLTGKILWKKEFRRCLASSPVVRDGVVYQAVMHPRPCSSTNRQAWRGFVVAMDARTGRELWRFRAGVVESSPLLRGKTLYFGSWDRHLYAVDIRKGTLRWRYRADDEVNTAPAYAGGTIFVGTDGGRVHAVWAKTGRNRWTSSSYSRLGRREHFYASPTVAYGRVFIGNTDGTVYAYGAASGRMLWARRAGSYVYTAAAVWRRTVYVGSYDGNVYAFDAATGAERWRRALPAALHGAPTIMAGRIYFATCGTCGQRGSRYAKSGPSNTFALDARTGRVVWRFRDGHYSPVVADWKRLYLIGKTSVYGLVERRAAKPAAAKPTTAEPKRTR